MRFPPLTCAFSLLLLLGCEQQEKAAASTPLDAAAAQFSRIKAKSGEGSVIIDVRSAAEFEAGHINGALNIPLEEITAHFDELPGLDVPLVVYCETGRRSAEATKFLLEWGHRKVHDAGGLAPLLEQQRMEHAIAKNYASYTKSECLE